jgi:hypothetical protein
MSLQELHLSAEDSRIMRIAERLIAEEMQFVRDELEMLRADMHQSYADQRSRTAKISR